MNNRNPNRPGLTAQIIFNSPVAQEAKKKSAEEVDRDIVNSLVKEGAKHHTEMPGKNRAERRLYARKVKHRARQIAREQQESA